jgi:Holliday junction resolvasome RuvABC endonuclease subunit
MPRVMGLDLGSRMAWAIGEPNTKPRTGADRLRLPNEIPHAATSRLQIRLMTLFDSKHRPDVVVIERVWVQGQKHPDVAELMVGSKHIVVSTCNMYGISYCIADSSTVAKFCVGKGKWTKDEGGRAQKKLDIQNWAAKRELIDIEEVGDADKADAIALWFYGCHVAMKAPETKLFMFGEAPSDAYEEA